MKKLIVLVVVILSTTAIYAETYPEVFFEDNKTLIVNVNDGDNPNVEIEIRDLNGKVLHTENFQVGSLNSKKYNLKNLPNGTYELIIHSNTEKTVYPITVTFDGVKMSPVKNTIIFKPVIAYENNLIEFSQLTLGRDVTFILSDKKGPFYTKKFNNAASINANFSVEKLPEGDYTITVESDKQYDTFKFKK